jgi:ribose transport system permease protein
MSADTSIERIIDQRTHRDFLPWMLSRQTFWVFVAAILACLALSLLTTTFATPGNIFNVLRNFTFVAIIALGMTAVIITGGIDLSVGSTVLVSAITTSVLMSAGLPIFVALPAAIVASLAVGLVNGVLIAIFGMPPFVVTLGMMSVARSLGMVASQNKMIFQFGPDQAILLGLGGGSLLGVPIPTYVMVILTIIVGFMFRWTRWGRHLYAIGGNERAAVLTGVSVKAVKISVYMFAAFTAGIAGFLEAGWLGSVTTNLGQGMELTVIAAAVIGGANLAGGSGTALGAVVGAALIEVIRNSLILLGISTFWQGTFVGCFIVIAVAFDRLRDRETSE